MKLPAEASFAEKTGCVSRAPLAGLEAEQRHGREVQGGEASVGKKRTEDWVSPGH